MKKTSLIKWLITFAQLLTITFSFSQTHQWSFNIAGGTIIKKNAPVVNELITDVSGNTYVTGLIWDTTDFDPGVPTAYKNGIPPGNPGYIFLAKYGVSGNYAWAHVFGTGGTSAGVASYAEQGLAIELDQAGNVVMAGFYKGSVDFDPGSGVAMYTSLSTGIIAGDGFVVKYDPAGNYISGFSLRSTGASSLIYSLISDIKYDSQGNLYITGGMCGGIDFDPTAGTNTISSGTVNAYFLAKYNSTGNLLWAFHLKANGGSQAPLIHQGEQTKLTVDLCGNVYLTGEMRNTWDLDPGAGTQTVTATGLSDFFLSKFDVNGNFVWGFNVGGG